MEATTSTSPAGPGDLSRVWLGASIVGLLAGAALALGFDQERAAEVAWALTTLVGILPIARDVIGGLIRREPGVDLIALIAMAAALALGEYLAGAVIALMLASGQALEAYRRPTRPRGALRAARAGAARRSPATSDGRAGRTTDRRGAPGRPAAREDRRGRAGRRGVDGRRRCSTSRPCTGESRPVDRPQDDLVRSGAVNAGAGVRPARDRLCRGEHVRGHRAARAGGAGREGARGPAGRPVRRDLHPDHAGDRGRGVGRHGRPAPLPRGRCRGDAVPPDPRGADRDRGRHLEVGQARASSSRAAARSRPSPEARVLMFDKTGHAHVWRAHRRRGRDVRRRRTPASCCAWPPRSTRSRRTCWRRRSSERPRERRRRARVPRRRDREARRRHRGRGRAAPGRARQGVVRLGRRCRFLGGRAMCGGDRCSTARRACSSPSTGRWPARSSSTIRSGRTRRG